MKGLSAQIGLVLLTASLPLSFAMGGLPPGVVAVTTPFLVALLTLTILRRSAPAVTLLAVTCLVAVALRQEVDPSAVRVLGTSATLLVFLLSTLRWVDGVPLLPGGAAASLTAGSVAVSGAVLVASASTAAHGVVPLALGLAVTLAAYRLAVPSALPATDQDSAAKADDGP